MFNKNKFLASTSIILAVFLVSFFIQTNSVKAAVSCDSDIVSSCRIDHTDEGSLARLMSVDAFGSSYSLGNESSDPANDTFIPLGTATEWEEFKLYRPSHITLSLMSTDPETTPEDPQSCGENVSFTYMGGSAYYGTVSSPDTGRCWLDRNLGASRVAISSTDTSGYGHLFQWGRLDDKHQDRYSDTTTQLSPTDTPPSMNYIINGSFPYDWRDPQNDDLWNPTNLPCPSGWTVPTAEEWTAEVAGWTSGNSYYAFNSVLKLPEAGFRDNHGTLNSLEGRYWTKTTAASTARGLRFDSGLADVFTFYRASGLSVRCIKIEMEEMF